MGLVEVKGGRGAYVSANSLSSFIDRAVRPILIASPDLLDLIEVRELMETESARLAADRRTDEHLQRLQQRLAVDREKMSLHRYNVDDDLDFHRILFEAAGNTVLLHFIEIVGELMRALRQDLSREEILSRTLADHVVIYEAVRDRKGAEAVAKMCAHVRDTERAILAQTNQSDTDPDLLE